MKDCKLAKNLEELKIRIKFDINSFDQLAKDSPVVPRTGVETNDVERAIEFLYENLKSLKICKEEFPSIKERTFEPLKSPLKLSEIMKEFEGEKYEGFLGRYYDNNFRRNKNSLILMHSDCISINQKERNNFALEIVENHPENRLMNHYKENGFYTVFIFSQEDYDAYLTYLHTSGLVRPLYLQTEFLF